MLQKLHEYIKGWVASLLIGLIALAFVLWGVEYYVAGTHAEGKVLAVVDGQKITEDQVNKLFLRVQRQAQASGRVLSPLYNAQLKATIVQKLIAETALSKAAKQQGFQLDQQQVQQEILRAPLFQVNGQFSPSRLQQFLYANNLSEQSFLEQVQTSMLIDQMQNGLQASAFVLPYELETYYDLLKQERSFSYVVVSSQRFKDRVQVTEQQLRHYYNNNLESFRAPEQVSIEYLQLSPKTISEGVKITDEDAKHYYQQNPANYKAQAFSTVKNQIIAALKSQKAEQLFASMSDQLSTLTYTNPDSLQPAAKALNIKLQTSELFSHQGAQSGVAANANVVEAAFSKDVLQQQNNSSPITLRDGGVLVLRVKQHHRSQVLAFAQVESQIRVQLLQELAQAKAILLANDLQLALNRGVSINQVAAKNQLTVVSKTNISRQDTVVPAAILSPAFELAAEKGKNTRVVMLKNGDAAIIQLTAIKKPDYSQVTQKEKEQLQKQLQGFSGQLIYMMYAYGVKNSSKIKINLVS